MEAWRQEPISCAFARRSGGAPTTCSAYERDVSARLDYLRSGDPRSGRGELPLINMPVK